jgi:hypothetical protein
MGGVGMPRYCDRRISTGLPDSLPDALEQIYLLIPISRPDFRCTPVPEPHRHNLAEVRIERTPGQEVRTLLLLVRADLLWVAIVGWSYDRLKIVIRI